MRFKALNHLVKSDRVAGLKLYLRHILFQRPCYFYHTKLTSRRPTCLSAMVCLLANAADIGNT